MENSKVNNDSCNQKKRKRTVKIKDFQLQKEIMNKIDTEISKQCPNDIKKDNFLNDKIKIAPSTYYKYLNCSIGLNINQLKKLVSALGLSYDYIFDKPNFKSKSMKDEFAEILKNKGYNFISANMIASLFYSILCTIEDFAKLSKKKSEM